MMIGRGRRSKTVGPGLKMNRMALNHKGRNDGNPIKDRVRLGVGRQSRVNLMRRIAGYFEEMVEFASNEGVFDDLEELVNKNIQLPPDKMEVINSIQGKIIKESLNSKLIMEMQTLKELGDLITADKEINSLDNCISEVLDLRESQIQEAKKMVVDENKAEIDFRYSKECVETIDKFTTEFVDPTLNAVARRNELLEAVEKKSEEMSAIINEIISHQ